MTVREAINALTYSGSQVSAGRDDAVVELWQNYKSSGDRDARDHLIIYYSPLVRHVAGRMAAELPNSVDISDLVSYGILGLMDAIEKFDLDRDIRFETYAMGRVRGAILDELRAIDWVPRSVRAKAREADRALAKLEHDLQRSPTDTELAAEMGMTLHDLQELFRQTSVACVLQLDNGVFGRGEGTLGDQIADDGSAAPGVELESREMRRILDCAIARLGDRERTVVQMYYFEGLNLAAIAGLLHVTESRACQIHGKAVIELRNKLARALREPA
jgi:RNA polymerase sigma factor for flagellar operon FliA